MATYTFGDSELPVSRGSSLHLGRMIVIEGNLTINGKDFDLKLTTNQSVRGFPGEFSSKDYILKLIDVVPYPDSSKPDQAQDQHAILLISKRSN